MTYNVKFLWATPYNMNSKARSTPAKCRSNVGLCRSNIRLRSIRQCCFDIKCVAGVDQAYESNRRYL